MESNAEVNSVTGGVTRSLNMLSSSVTRLPNEGVKKAFANRLSDLVDVLFDETASLAEYDGKDIERRAEMFDVFVSKLTSRRKSQIFERFRALLKSEK